MTTVNTYQGLQNDRSSSRVLRPPGGASSDIFGSDDTESQATKTPAQGAQAAEMQQQNANARDQAAASKKASEKSSIFGDSAPTYAAPKESSKPDLPPQQDESDSPDSYSQAQAQAAASKKANYAGSDIFGGPLSQEETPRAAPKEVMPDSTGASSESAEAMHAAAQAKAAAAKKANYEGSHIFGGSAPEPEVVSPRQAVVTPEPSMALPDTAEAMHAAAQAKAAAAKKANYEGSHIFGDPAPQAQVEVNSPQEPDVVVEDRGSLDPHASVQQQAAAAKKANYEGSNIFGGPLPPQPTISTSPRQAKSAVRHEAVAQSVSEDNASGHAQAAAAKEANYRGSNIFGGNSSPEPSKPRSPPSVPTSASHDGESQHSEAQACAAASKKANYEGSNIFGGPLAPNSARSPRSPDSLSQAQAQAQASKRANYEGSNIFGGPTAPSEGRTSGKQQHQQQSEVKNPVAGPETQAQDVTDNRQSKPSASAQQSANTRASINPITGLPLRGWGDAQDPMQPQQQPTDGGFNPITGQAYGASQGSVPSTKVRQPPGGASQGLW